MEISKYKGTELQNFKCLLSAGADQVQYGA